MSGSQTNAGGEPIGWRGKIIDRNKLEADIERFDHLVGLFAKDPARLEEVLKKYPSFEKLFRKMSAARNAYFKLTKSAWNSLPKKHQDKWNKWYEQASGQQWIDTAKYPSAEALINDLGLTGAVIELRVLPIINQWATTFLDWEKNPENLAPELRTRMEEFGSFLTMFRTPEEKQTLLKELKKSETIENVLKIAERYFREVKDRREVETIEPADAYETERRLPHQMRPDGDFMAEWRNLLTSIKHPTVFAKGDVKMVHWDQLPDWLKTNITRMFEHLETSGGSAEEWLNGMARGLADAVLELPTHVLQHTTYLSMWADGGFQVDDGGEPIAIFGDGEIWHIGTDIAVEVKETSFILDIFGSHAPELTGKLVEKGWSAEQTEKILEAIDRYRNLQGRGGLVFAPDPVNSQAREDYAPEGFDGNLKVASEGLLPPYENFPFEYSIPGFMNTGSPDHKLEGFPAEVVKIEIPASEKIPLPSNDYYSYKIPYNAQSYTSENLHSLAKMHNEQVRWFGGRAIDISPPRVARPPSMEGYTSEMMPFEGPIFGGTVLIEGVPPMPSFSFSPTMGMPLPAPF